jgi:WD40 repeat protein
MVRSAFPKQEAIRVVGIAPFLLGIIWLLVHMPAISAQMLAQPRQTPDVEELEQLWDSLARDDAGKAYQTIWKLVETPEASLVLLDKKLESTPAPDLKRIDRLVEQLGDKKYAVRIKAHEALKKIGPLCRPALEKALEHPSEEVRKRAELVLRFLNQQGLPPAELQVWRSIQVLEYIGTEEAQHLLKRLAAGAPGVWQTEEAQAALKRLDRKNKVVPLVQRIQKKLTLSGHTGRLYGLAFSFDGKILASASSEGTVKLWDVGSGKEMATLHGHTGSIWSVSFTADGKALTTSGSDNTIRLWDLATFKEQAVLQGHGGTVYSAVIHPQGKLLASGSSDSTVKIWDPVANRLLNTFRGHTALIWGVDISPDGKTAASASSDRNVILWEIATGNIHATLQGHTINVRTVAFNNTGKLLASAGGDNTARIWEVATGKELLTLRGHGGDIRSLAFRADGKTLATASADNTVKLWDAIRGKELATLEGHRDKARSVAFSGDGRLLASGGYDSQIFIWEVGEP